MIFVNSRRLSERLALAINEEADEEIALAHHGSIAKDTRVDIEDRLKQGQLPAIVATSSLELGIDMGAVDLVIQIESPPSIASGMQRIGRSGHRVNAVSRGVIFPKFRGDLLSCSAATERMLDAEVESTRYPRNPLDVFAQQIVAMVSRGSTSVDQLFATVRRAAPFHDLPRSALEGVLDLLSGRYPSDEFSELRPRINWDRVTGRLSGRQGAQRLAVLNAGVIPDRGLYGVFLAGDDGTNSRVGELDEEMVFETKVGEVFLLGASSWRALEITSDRVLVAPAPGEPGRMPFWRGDGPGRPLEFGQAIGKLTRELLALKRDQALRRLRDQHALQDRAAHNLMDYLNDQVESAGAAPTDRTLVVESFVDEVGDWRVVVLTPFGSPVHAPWTTAVLRRLRERGLGEVDCMWTDDGMAFRIAETNEPPPAEWFFPPSDEIEDLVVSELGGSALFAARFRENAARALLLPRQRPGKRTPLWLQRRRSSDLLAVAAKYESFPILLETYRECLRDIFDMDGLKSILRQVEQRQLRLHQTQTREPSPFAATLLFNYVGKFIYDGDAPLAERRAAALALDHVQLRELLGEAELREMLDPDAIEQLQLELQRLDDKRPLRGPDDLHDLLLHVGDLSGAELAERCGGPEPMRQLGEWMKQLQADRRIIELNIASQRRLAAAEDAARFRDALGVALPLGLPSAFLQEVADPLGDLISRYARTHAPFTAGQVAERFGLGVATVRLALQRLAEQQRVIEGEFLPGRKGKEWCSSEILRRLKQRSLARLRQRVEPVEQQVLARFLPAWQGVARPRQGLDALLDVVEQLQGFSAPASEWETLILPTRLAGFQPRDLDELCSAGELIWRGVSPLGAEDGRIALFLTDHYRLLAPPCQELTEDGDELAGQILRLLQERGAVFYEDMVHATGQFAPDVLNAIWRLVWCGHVTNDTLAPLRSLRRPKNKQRSGGRRGQSGRGFRSRRATQAAGSEGRWSLLPSLTAAAGQASTTERQTAIAAQLIRRHGVVTRETLRHEEIEGGFSGVYPVLKAMEESGKLRRGYFVAGLGAAQFAAPGADDRLRELRDSRDNEATLLILAATDPASPFGWTLPWPACGESKSRLQRAAGARVLLLDGELIGYLSRGQSTLQTFVSEEEPARAMHIAALVEGLVRLCRNSNRFVPLQQIDGLPPSQSPLGKSLAKAGVRASSHGLRLRDDLPQAAVSSEPS